MTLTNNFCDCVESGECLCRDSICMCDCECYGCSVEMISDCICEMVNVYVWMTTKGEMYEYY